jgi:hypothetical protein
VQVVGTRAYVAGPNCLRIVDVGDPSSLVLLGSLAIPVADLYVVGWVAYVANESGLQIIDVIDAAHPILRGSYDLPLGDDTFAQSASRLHVAGDLAYIIFQQTISGIPPYRSELAIVDVRDSSKPALISRYNHGASFADVTIADGYAYLGGTSDGGGATGRFFNAYLLILNVQQPASPALVGSYRGAELLFQGGVGAIAVAGDIVYLGVTNGASLYIMDVHDRTRPAVVGSLPISASDLRVQGQFLYVAGTPNGLMVRDIRNPAAPAARYSDDGTPALRGVDVAGEIIYAASDTWLRAARFLPRTTALIPAGGGTIEATVGRVTYAIPPGAFDDTVLVNHMLRLANAPPPAPALTRIGPLFEVTASYSATGLLASPALPITITVGYTEAERGAAVASTPALYYWDGSAWVQEAGSTLDQSARTVVVATKRLGIWALMGEARRASLPVLRR